MSRTITLSFELLEAFVALIRSGGDAARAMRALGINLAIVTHDEPAILEMAPRSSHIAPLVAHPSTTQAALDE